MRKRHGDLEYFLVRDEVLVITRNRRDALRIRVDANLGANLEQFGIAPGVVGTNAEKLFRFDHMFRKANLPSFQPDKDDLTELGRVMTKTAGSSSASSLPAGYTFLGQFIDHDLTFNSDPSLTLGGTPVNLMSKRSPSLDLDSLYGLAPDDVKKTDLGKQIYEGDKLKEGWTDEVHSSLPSTHSVYFHDLPRGSGSREAALIDPRNDENLAVAQTHLAFIKFHNAMVDRLKETSLPEKLFSDAQESVIRHYQRVILDDFLPAILEPTVVAQMQAEGPQYFLLEPGVEMFMPLEFAVAAFRMGHSQVTSHYEWNGVFEKPKSAPLEELFIFTGHGGLRNRWHITSDWIIDWTRFFDFSDFLGELDKPSSKAGTIDAIIEKRLGQLTPIPNHDETRFLAVRNLLRGLDVGLPAGQHVAKELGYPMLEPQDFAHLPYYDTLHQFNFDELTPLWLYILHEAKVQNDGERLGFVGSRIVAETLLTLIQNSRTTVMPPGTKWKTPQEGEKFGMANLLMLVNDASPNKDFLNPLG